MSNPLDMLIPAPSSARDGETWHWATVTSLSPLQVRLDGDSAPLLVVPENLFGPLAVGERVWVQRYGRRLLLHGAAAPNVVRRNVVSDTPSGSDYIYAGAPGSSSESALRLQRTLGTDQMEYWLQSGISKEVNLIVQQNGSNHSIFRSGSNGQLSMQTFAASGTAAATRPLPFAMADGGPISFGSGIAPGGTIDVAVTFPSGRFTAFPKPFVISNNYRFSWAVVELSLTGATFRGLNVTSGTSGSANLRWLAVQMEV